MSVVLPKRGAATRRRPRLGLVITRIREIYASVRCTRAIVLGEILASDLSVSESGDDPACTPGYESERATRRDARVPADLDILMCER